MKIDFFKNCIYIICFIQLVIFSCKKDEVTQKPEPKLILRVNLNTTLGDRYNKWFLAAYTTQGELLGIGSLTDSSLWTLKCPNYNDPKINVLLYNVWDDNNADFLNVWHFKDLEVGHVISSSSSIKNYELKPNNYKNKGNQDEKHKINKTSKTSNIVKLILEVEDFGNRIGESTATSTYESKPSLYGRGLDYPYSGTFDWDEIINGFTYKEIGTLNYSSYQGFVLTLIERGTNKPFIYYNNTDITTYSDNDTITINKSDFNEGTLNSVEVVSTNNNFNNLYLYLYNSENGKVDLRTSYDTSTPDAGNTLKYFSSSILPISRWVFYYVATYSNTSCIINSNEAIPSSIEIQGLTGQNIVDEHEYKPNTFMFTHGNIFSNQELKRSQILFDSYNNNVGYYYELIFDSNQSFGTIHFTLFDIPDLIISEYPTFQSSYYYWDNIDYTQVYSNSSIATPTNYFNYLLGIYLPNNTPYTISTYTKTF